jgi:hypothetical protein
MKALAFLIAEDGCGLRAVRNGAFCALLLATAPIRLVPLISGTAFWNERGFFRAQELMINPLAQPTRLCHEFLNLPQSV